MLKVYLGVVDTALKVEILTSGDYDSIWGWLRTILNCNIHLWGQSKQSHYPEERRSSCPFFLPLLEPSTLRLSAKYLKYLQIRINPAPRVSAKRWLCLPPHRLELVAWINGGSPTTSADETGFGIFEEFENIWKYLEYLNEQQGATSADETSPIRRNAC